MKKNTSIVVTLRVPSELDGERVNTFVESALRTESGFYEPEEPESQVEFLEAKKLKG